MISRIFVLSVMFLILSLDADGQLTPSNRYVPCDLGITRKFLAYS